MENVENGIVIMLEIVRSICNFLLCLRIKIKLMSEIDFNSMLSDQLLDMEQKIFLLYFRYC